MYYRLKSPRRRGEADQPPALAGDPGTIWCAMPAPRATSTTSTTTRRPPSRPALHRRGHRFHRPDQRPRRDLDAVVGRAGAHHTGGTMTLSTSSPTGTDAVLAEPRDHVVVLTINRPQARNALSSEVLDGLVAGLDWAEEEA